MVHHRRGVGDLPALDDAAAGDAFDREEGGVEGAAGGGEPGELADVGAGDAAAHGHPVAVGDEIEDLHVELQRVVQQRTPQLRTGATGGDLRWEVVVDDV